MNPTLLVAGIGNVFLGDDGFGVEVALSLVKRPLPESVLVKDFGIRGFDLAYALLEPWETIILVDALSRGEAPGTLYTMEPSLTGLRDGSSPETAMNLHGMDPVHVLQLAASMGTIQARVLIVGCEPHDFGDEWEGRMGLSPVVEGAVEKAADMVQELAVRILSARKLCAVE